MADHLLGYSQILISNGQYDEGMERLKQRSILLGIQDEDMSEEAETLLESKAVTLPQSFGSPKLEEFAGSSEETSFAPSVWPNYFQAPPDDRKKITPKKETSLDDIKKGKKTALELMERLNKDENSSPSP